ncbi:MAG: FAD-dependent oxidoreductase [Candidatus Thermoplasmatota archaeon]|nr:FAD-dependent oxidoreductase [Candidatus Thermoplasmatota archaeon]
MASLSGKLAELKIDHALITFSITLEDQFPGFIPGQYCRVTMTDAPSTDIRGNSRTFCVTKYDGSERKVTFCTMKGPSAFKSNLQSLRIGHIFKVQGPFGNFYLPGESERNVFIAYGIGITSMISIASLIVERETGSAIFLHGSYPDGFFPLRKEMEEITANSDHARYIPVMTLEGDEKNSVGFSRILQDNSFQYIESATFYLSGPDKIMKEIRNDLMLNRISQDNIRSEFYTGY